MSDRHEDDTELLVEPGITKNSRVAGGDACIAGTRIPVWALDSYRRLGWGDAKILDNFPALVLRDLANAENYAARNQDEIDTAILANAEETMTTEDKRGATMGEPMRCDYKPNHSPPKCSHCGDTGIIETGNNDLHCDCEAGATAILNVCMTTGPGKVEAVPMTRAQVEAYRESRTCVDDPSIAKVVYLMADMTPEDRSRCLAAVALVARGVGPSETADDDVDESTFEAWADALTEAIDVLAAGKSVDAVCAELEQLGRDPSDVRALAGRLALRSAALTEDAAHAWAASECGHYDAVDRVTRALLRANRGDVPLEALPTSEHWSANTGVEYAGSIRGYGARQDAKAAQQQALAPGARVRTADPLTWSCLYAPEFNRTRRAGITGEIRSEYGDGWTVRHDDGTEAPYDASELTVVPVRHVVEQLAGSPLMGDDLDPEDRPRVDVGIMWPASDDGPRPAGCVCHRLAADKRPCAVVPAARLVRSVEGVESMSTREILATVVIISIIMGAGVVYRDFRPAKQEPCRESAEALTWNTDVTCEPGQTIEIVGDEKQQRLLTCRCPKAGGQ